MDHKKMMGYESPADQKVPIRMGDWGAMKLALWRSRHLADIAVREALEILQRCQHAHGCPGKDDELEPCFQPTFVTRPSNGDGEDDEAFDELAEELATRGCPDREQRMSALVILNAARQLAPADARKPADGPYFAPSREYFSEILAELYATQIENQMLRRIAADAGLTVPDPQGNSNGGGGPLEPAQVGAATGVDPS